MYNKNTIPRQAGGNVVMGKLEIIKETEKKGKMGTEEVKERHR